MGGGELIARVCDLGILHHLVVNAPVPELVYRGPGLEVAREAEPVVAQDSPLIMLGGGVDVLPRQTTTRRTARIFLCARVEVWKATGVAFCPAGPNRSSGHFYKRLSWNSSCR